MNTGATALLEPARAAASAELPAGTLEDFLRLTSAAQRDDFLALARRQGLLYPHQIPLRGNGHHGDDEETARSNQLNHLLTGHADLEPVREASFEPVDAALDARQRQAVARALATPDLAVIVGWPGTGKSRVVAEILTQAALRGERILFVARHAAAIDRVLPDLAGCDALYPVRLLEPTEAPEALPPALRPLTLPLRSQHLQGQVLASARRCQDAADSQCRQRRQEHSLWPRLERLVEQAEQLNRQRLDLERRESQVTAEIEAQLASSAASPDGPHTRFAREVRVGRRRHQEALKQSADQGVQAEKLRAGAVQTLLRVAGALAALRPLAQAKERGRWWTWKWWRATLRGKVLVRLAELECAHHQALQTRASAEQELEKLDRRRHELERDHTAMVDRLKSAEIDRRRRALRLEATPLEQALQKLIEQWQPLVGRLAESVRPAAMSGPALDAARLVWQNRLHHDEEQCKFAHHWTAFLQQACGPRGERLLSLVNLVAGTTHALAQDRHFSSDEAFDLLVVEEADQISEAEFLKLARRARRWVLVGEPAWEYEAAPAAPARSTLPGPFAFLHKLWQLLHWDPRGLTGGWAWEGDRLCCRLRPVSGDQRRWLELESVADAPHIELRILNLPRTPPVLAEIVFPPATTLAQAKEYLYREVEEVAVQGIGRSATLRDENDRLVLQLGEETEAAPILVSLAPGLRECLTPVLGNGAAKPLPRTECFEFDKSAGWSRESVAAWATCQLRFRDLGRTTWLDVQHRVHPDLARVLDRLVFAEEALPAVSTDAFVVLPVPPLRPREARRPQDRHRGLVKAPPALPRHGAGLEQDLAVPRHGDRLPTELRPLLPSRGIVNFLEAQALVGKLEELTRQGKANGSETVSTAVVAFSAAQVELIRLLVRRSPVLTAARANLPISLPDALGQREFDRVLVSLTRSHGHRAVPLAENFATVILALTRARRQLFLFADVGTLLRRSEFAGRLEHLDEAASAREARFAADLVAYLRDITCMSPPVSAGQASRIG